MVGLFPKDAVPVRNENVPNYIWDIFLYLKEIYGLPHVLLWMYRRTRYG